MNASSSDASPIDKSNSPNSRSNINFYDQFEKSEFHQDQHIELLDKVSNIELFEGGGPEKEYPKDSLNYLVDKNYKSFFLALFLVGIFNNNGYVLVQAGSKSIADSFGKSDLMASFQFAMTSISICTRYANGSFLVNIPHLTRVMIVTMLQLTSFIGIALASYLSDPENPKDSLFYLSLFASVLTGISCGMGEGTFLGFLKGFPSHTVGYVSSGTGFAGIFGTLTLLTLQALNLSNTAIFLLATPTVCIYFASFSWLNTKKKKHYFFQVDHQEET